MRSSSVSAALLACEATSSATNCSCLARGIRFIASLSFSLWASGIETAISLNYFYSFSRCLIVYCMTFFSAFLSYFFFCSTSIVSTMALMFGPISYMRLWAFSNSCCSIFCAFWKNCKSLRAWSSGIIAFCSLLSSSPPVSASHKPSKCVACALIIYIKPACRP